MYSQSRLISLIIFGDKLGSRPFGGNLKQKIFCVILAGGGFPVLFGTHRRSQTGERLHKKFKMSESYFQKSQSRKREI